MKLMYPDYSISFELCENEVPVIVIENPQIFSKLVKEFLLQSNGQEGGFILSEADKIRNISKETQIILNPFSLDCNEKRIIQKLYQEIEIIASEKYVEDSGRLHGEIVEYLDTLLNNIPYATTYCLNENVPALLKAYGVQIDTQADSFLESVINYLRVLNSLCHIEVVICVNLKTFLSDEQILQLYEFVFYQKMYLVLFENNQRKILKGEKTCILDKDQCIIHVK